MTGNQYYTFPRPIKRVAIIGAGPSGTPASRHLRDAGLDVTLFERQDQVGGVWNWKEEAVRPQSIPTPPPSRGAFTPVQSESGGVYNDSDHSIRDRFSPPNPCYWNLSNNVPTKTMAFKDFPFPPGTPYNIPHYELAEYVHRYWAHFKLEGLTRLNTRVEKAFKRADGLWELKLRQIKVDGDNVEETIYRETFDAVVNATGHYNAPFIPSIPGASEWYSAFPSQILHSQGYRRPETYAGKTVLIIGAGTSGMDIARDLEGHVGRLFISSRVDPTAPKGYQAFRTIQASSVPESSVKIGEITRFVPPSPGQSIQEAEIETVGGTVSGVDYVIWCTGYQYSFPYLPQYHRDPGTVVDSTKSTAPVVEKGDFVHNVYRDVFYIPDPTLAFIGLSVNTSAFSFFEFQSISVARVFSDAARLPSQRDQQLALASVVARKGKGKFRHFMGKEGERAYVRETAEWLNRDAEWSGTEQVVGHTEEWLWESDQAGVRMAARLGLDPSELRGIADLSGNADVPGRVEDVLAGLGGLEGLVEAKDEGREVLNKEFAAQALAVA